MTLASIAPLSAVRVASEVTALLEGLPVDEERLEIFQPRMVKHEQKWY